MADDGDGLGELLINLNLTDGELLSYHEFYNRLLPFVADLAPFGPGAAGVPSFVIKIVETLEQKWSECAMVNRLLSDLYDFMRPGSLVLHVPYSGMCDEPLGNRVLQSVLERVNSVPGWTRLPGDTDLIYMSRLLELRHACAVIVVDDVDAMYSRNDMECTVESMDDLEWLRTQQTGRILTIICTKESNALRVRNI